VRDAYVVDHGEDKRMLAELARRIEDAKKTGASTPELVRAAVALTTHVELHVKKENESLVPLFAKLFSPEEQGAHIGKMMARFDPAELARVFPWMIGRLEPSDRVAYLTMARGATPPDRFAGVVKTIRAGVSAEIWRGIAAAMPGISPE
jgi:hypothetical protein